MCVELGGEIVADLAVGKALIGSGTPLAHDSVMPLFSSAKPITSVAIGALVDSLRLNFDDPVATHVPEFATHGKSNIQVRHLMNHTSGLADDALFDGGSSRAEVIAGICDSVPVSGWVPGDRAAYLPTAGWHMLGEVVERVSGSSFRSFVQSFVLDPLRMGDTYPVVGPDLAERLGPRLAVMHNTRRQPMTPDPQYLPDQLGRFVRPGSSFHGLAHDVVKLYSMLLRNGVSAEGERILSGETVRMLTTRQHDGLLDETFGVVMDRGLGFLSTASGTVLRFPTGMDERYRT